MGFPTSFDESNAVLSRPVGTTDDECGPLSICRTNLKDGNPVVISCWKFTKEEIEEIVKTGRVWLMLWGVTMPPAFISGQKPFT